MKSFHQFIPYTDRLDYQALMSNNVAYVQTVEAGIDIRHEPTHPYVGRELTRISSTSGDRYNGMDVGAYTMFSIPFEREELYNLFEMLCGTRLTTSHQDRRGGSGFAPRFIERCHTFTKVFPQRSKSMTLNATDLDRSARGVGVIGAEAIDLITGPNHRASGVSDLRRVEPYLLRSPVGTAGDYMSAI